MAIATMCGFNDLGHSVNSTWEVKKIQDFCPWDIESCHLVTARCVETMVAKLELVLEGNITS